MRLRVLLFGLLATLAYPTAGAEDWWPGKHLFVSVQGKTLHPTERAMLGELRPGGVVLLGPNVGDEAQTRALVAEIKQAAGMGAGVADWPLIAVDQEGGVINRLRLDPAPSARALGEAGDPDAARVTARRYAETCRAWGIGVILAPVLDVHTPGESGVIGSRSFGGDPEQVIRMGLAFARGVMDGGAIPVAKHYPGHGSARQDSHHGLAVLEETGAALERHMKPFAAAAAWGIPGIMPGHIAVPALESPENAHRPASLSPVLIRDWLRTTYDYNQVVLTDDIAMGAITEGKPGATVRALAAGCDAVILFGSPGEVRAACAAIEAALADGRLSRESLAASSARLDAWQTRLREGP